MPPRPRDARVPVNRVSRWLLTCIMGRRARFYAPLSSQVAWLRPGTESIIEDAWFVETVIREGEGSCGIGVLQDQVARGGRGVQ